MLNKLVNVFFSLPTECRQELNLLLILTLCEVYYGLLENRRTVVDNVQIMYTVLKRIIKWKFDGRGVVCYPLNTFFEPNRHLKLIYHLMSNWFIF